MSIGKLKYTKAFAPERVHKPELVSREAGDQRINPIYVYRDDIVLAVNVALATRRPLLIRGPSGCGKSSLAHSVADILGWRYYETVITSRTEARDLCWQVDLLRRLHDAQTPGKDVGDDFTPYVRPGVLWWAFDRESAARRGAGTGKPTLADPCGEVDHPRAVILIDEIDKADPDVPNNLLVPLGSMQFQVEETGVRVWAKEENAPLVIVTTNDERELPNAFLRRCVELRLEWPSQKALVEIGKAHFPNTTTKLLKKVCETLAASETPGAEAKVSVAEFLDTLRAFLTLKVRVGTREWEALELTTIWKHGRKKGA